MTRNRPVTHAASPAQSLRQRPWATSRGRLWTGFGVALAAAGCVPPGPRASRGATDAFRHAIGVDSPVGAQVSYLRAGDPGGVRLVLVHGTPGSATGWADFVLQPPPGFDVVALDRPGFGLSAPDRPATSLGTQAAAVAALLGDASRPAVLLGHSLGGAIAARVASDHPGRVRALVLVSSSLDPALETTHPLQHLGAWPLVRDMLPRAIRHANAELMALKPELEALALRLPEIRSKVVILHGTRDDLVPVANVGFMQSRLRGARCVRTVLLPGRNHFLPWNSVDEVRAAIRSAVEDEC